MESAAFKFDGRTVSERIFLIYSYESVYGSARAKKEEFPLEALKAASHRKRFGCGLKRAALLSGGAFFPWAPIIGIAFATKRAPVLKTPPPCGSQGGIGIGWPAPAT